MYETLAYLENECMLEITDLFGMLELAEFGSISNGYTISFMVTDTNKQVVFEFKEKNEPRVFLIEYSYDHYNDPAPDYTVKCESDVTEDVKLALTHKYVVLAIIARKILVGG